MLVTAESGVSLDQTIATLEADLAELRAARGETQALVWVNLERRITRVSEGWCELFGFEADAVIGQHPARLLRPGMGSSPAFERHVLLLRAGEIHSFTWAGYVNGRRELAFVTTRMFGWRQDGRLTGFVTQYSPIDVFGALSNRAMVRSRLGSMPAGGVSRMLRSV